MFTHPQTVDIDSRHLARHVWRPSALELRIPASDPIPGGVCPSRAQQRPNSRSLKTPSTPLLDSFDLRPSACRFFRAPVQSWMFDVHCSMFPDLKDLSPAGIPTPPSSSATCNNLQLSAATKGYSLPHPLFSADQPSSQPSSQPLSESLSQP